MARSPLPLGTWGKIRTFAVASDRKGKATRYAARARYRDFDGTNAVEAHGRTKTAAENALRNKLKARSTGGGGSRELTALHRFSAAAELWSAQFEEAVTDGTRSPTSLDTYRRHLKNHVLPALGEIRLGEARTPLIDNVITGIKANAGTPTAKTCRSIISGVMGLAVRYGAVPTNPVRDIGRIEGHKKLARALTEQERAGWFEQLQADERAVSKDLPDLTTFMLGTGVRIGEALAVLWEQVDLEAGAVDITHTIVRVRGEGLIRKPTKSSAGERVLQLPRRTMSMLRSRFAVGGRLDQPVFADSEGGFRDPANTRRDLRDARSPAGGETRQLLGKQLRAARRATKLTQSDVASALNWPKTRVSLIETARVRLSPADATTLLDLYDVTGAERAGILELVDAAADSSTDALAWITSHSFRKTVATILDEAGQFGRQVADQLGHARASMTQDHYIGRKVLNPGAASALDAALEPPDGPNV